MSVYYDLYQTPDLAKSGKEQPLHARVVLKGSYTAAQFIDRVVALQHVPHAQLVGILDGVTAELQDLLLEGYSVELGGIGRFTLSLKVSKQATDPKEIHSPSVSLKDINLRINRRFKQELESRLDLQFHRSPFRVEHPQGREECWLRLEKFLEEHPCINRQDYAVLVGKTKRQALQDIDAFLKKGILKKYGTGRSVVYIKAR